MDGDNPKEDLDDSSLSRPNSTSATKTNYCPKCGNKRNPNDMYCGSCGHKFESDSSMPGPSESNGVSRSENASTGQNLSTRPEEGEESKQKPIPQYLAVKFRKRIIFLLIFSIFCSCAMLISEIILARSDSSNQSNFTPHLIVSCYEYFVFVFAPLLVTVLLFSKTLMKRKTKIGTLIPCFILTLVSSINVLTIFIGFFVIQNFANFYDIRSEIPLFVFYIAGFVGCTYTLSLAIMFLRFLINAVKIEHPKTKTVKAVSPQPSSDSRISSNVFKEPVPSPSGKSDFDGHLIQLIGWIILGTFLTAITLGILFPFEVCWIKSWYCKHSIYDGRHVVFDGHGGQLLGHWILWELLILVTFGIFIFFVPVRIKKWLVSHCHFEGVNDPSFKSYFDGNTFALVGFAIVLFLFCLVTLFIGYPFALCWFRKWEFKHTCIDGYALHFDGNGAQLIGKWIIWLLLSLVTLGIFIFFIPVKVEKWKASHTHIADINAN